ncbi:MAG: hypothetical protein H7175_15450 [Burkholderiales bacterium]|nr:hypothetical protein [Anaerolineae bacterium]
MYRRPEPNHVRRFLIILLIGSLAAAAFLIYDTQIAAKRVVLPRLLPTVPIVNTPVPTLRPSPTTRPTFAPRTSVPTPAVTVEAQG